MPVQRKPFIKTRYWQEVIEIILVWNGKETDLKLILQKEMLNQIIEKYANSPCLLRKNLQIYIRIYQMLKKHLMDWCCSTSG